MALQVDIKLGNTTATSMAEVGEVQLTTKDTFVPEDIVVDVVSGGGITPTGNIALSSGTTDLTNIDVTNYATASISKIANGSAKVSASGTATAPTIAKTSTSATGATNVGVTTSTTAPSSGYFVSNQATAPATTITVTPEVTTAGYITSITNNGGTMSAKTGSVYYTTLATGALSVSGSVTNVNGSGSVNPGTNTISKNSATNVSVGTVTTTKPSSGYYVAVDASTEAGSGSVSVSGTNSTGASATVSTAGYVTTSQNKTGSVSGSGVASVTVNSKSASTTYIPITSGSATTPATTEAQSTPTITISDSGLITASVALKTKSITPTVSAGYVTSGTAGTVTMSSSSNTKLMTTKASTTYTPGTSNQTIASGTYLTGVQTIKGDVNLVASNIATGVEIFGVTGTFPGITMTSVSLPTASWTGTGPYTQTVTISGITSTTKVDLQLDSTLIAQMITDKVSALYITNNSGTLTAYAIGNKPTVNMTIQATTYEVNS